MRSRYSGKGQEHRKESAGQEQVTKRKNGEANVTMARDALLKWINLHKDECFGVRWRMARCLPPTNPCCFFSAQ